MKKIFDCGYTDKFSYTNKEDIILYLNGTNDSKNVKLYIKDLNGKIVKELVVPEIKNYFILENDYIPKYNDNKVNITPWMDFDLKPCISFNMNDFKSGIYLVDDNKEESKERDKLAFIIKESCGSDSFNRAFITYIMPTNTDMMYNYYGGKNGYYDFITKKSSNPNGPSKILGVKRPTNILRDYHFSFLKWLYNEKYKINYICDSDCENIYNLYWSNSDNYSTKLIIIGGHSEYWSEKARLNLDTILSMGVNLLCLSGNTMWTRISYSDNYDKLICIRSNDEIKYLPSKYKNDLSIRTRDFYYDKIPNSYSNLYRNETINECWYTHLTLGVDYLYGGWGTEALKLDETLKDLSIKNINKYYSLPNKLDFNSITFASCGEEYDGIITNFVESNDFNNSQYSKLRKNTTFIEFEGYKCEKLENFNEYIDKIELSSIYGKYYYSELIMVGFCFYPQETCRVRTTGIIKLKKTERSGTIINCCNMNWAAHFDDLYAYKLYRQNNITEEEKDELKETPAKIKKLTKQFISELLD